MPSIEAVEAALSLAEKDSSKVLGLTLGEQRINTPGQFVPKADAQREPQLSFNVSFGKYIVISTDIDAPFPSFGVLGPILHWIQPGYEPSNDITATGEAILKTSAPFVANYIGPAPPPGSSPHRYVFLLYEQPDGFDGKKFAPKNGNPLGNWQRMRFDLDAFTREAKLGPVLAANYFRSN
ncbi:YbhB/YbcL family Raf kinase inhibitor-like protein [Aspergillus clavatus NRRL 1]|uniref:Protease inhibitor (Tfs1), putative n=1 Tax=Aspergillus clavatus (strain ATCC 1007 / CBS 513.65 / DSM 816 / NCTC 3887 / NRRL 1 / QM 1276 / 107) TaxID=344612 RepID=A1CHC4_ASPCL|nr:protease inhibitor (Tfs1), putative [Aspergillus clavatus NRRL 1]EAW10279.1 protease inhibitor (Tfs1), putative [Aspergillus clavatus NRRL 1]